MKRILGIFIISFGFCFLNANAADYEDTYSKDEIGYDQFFSVQDNFKLVLKDNDIYVYDISGLGQRRITHTAKLNKPTAVFSKDRGYILYTEYSQEGEAGGELKYYRVKFDQDDNARQLISKDEYNALASAGQ